jgi:hypothetical protein
LPESVPPPADGLAVCLPPENTPPSGWSEVLIFVLVTVFPPPQKLSSNPAPTSTTQATTSNILGKGDRLVFSSINTVGLISRSLIASQYLQNN